MIGDWFVVLPGSGPAAPPVLDAARHLGGRVLARADGEAWIVGRCDTQHITTASLVGVHVALIGDHDVRQRELVAAVHGLLAGSETVMRFAGSYHAVIRDLNDTTLCGDVAGLRRVFTARVGDTTVLGSRAQALAQLAGDTSIDTRHLAHHLLGPCAPIALTEDGTTPYNAVRAAPPGLAARVTAKGGVELRRWWRAPDDTGDLEDGATALRTALSRAVTLRADGPRTAVELSGGLDSAAISALAFRACGSQLVNLSRASSHRGNDDMSWAAMVAEKQSGAAHEILAVDAIPGQFDGWRHPLPLDEPGPAALSPDRAMHLWHEALSHGSRVLLSGKGGDEVLLAETTYLRAAPWRIGRAHRRGWAALRGCTKELIRAEETCERDYAAAVSQALTTPMDWEAGPWVPAWLTDRARKALTERLFTAASTGQALGWTPHQHASLAKVRSMARLCRLQADAASSVGLRMSYPYLDREVIEACLRTRAWQRTSPYRFKPLLTEAMAGHLPDLLLARRTKGGYSHDDNRAMRRHRTDLAALLLDNSALADLGVIDPNVLRPVVEKWDRADNTTDLLLKLTLAAEVWARTAQGQPLTQTKERTSCTTSSRTAPA